MSVPKGKRSLPKLEAQHLALKIRKQVATELMSTFAYSQKRMDAHIRKVTAFIHDDEERERTAQRLRDMEESFDLWYISEERKAIHDLTRERHKLKAYKRLLDAGKMSVETVESCFKSWLGGYWRYMSRAQIRGISKLHSDLFGRRLAWKKRHGKLSWMMEH